MTALAPAAVPAQAEPRPALGTSSLSLAGAPSGSGPVALAAIPKAPGQNTLGFTTTDNLGGNDLDVEKKDTDATPIEFQVDLGSFANKDQVADPQGGYWLFLNFALWGYFVIDGDGIFDPWFDPVPETSLGDEPCRTGEWPLFDLFVNGHLVHTLMGTNDQPCDTESARTFEPIPMTPAEHPFQFRVDPAWVEKGKNTIRIELRDTGYTHPARDAFNDGHWMYLDWAQMELVAPPLFISGGWSFTFPPGGHAVEASGWEGNLGAKILTKFFDHFAQNPWDWTKAPALASAGSGGCPHSPAAPFSALDPFYPVILIEDGVERSVGGIVSWGKDGKQDFRVTGCQAAKAIRAASQGLGYCYDCGKDREGFWYMGFSMGGLIGRYAIQRQGLEPWLGKYVSLGTPHLGSHWANGYVQIADVWRSGYHDKDGDGLRKWWGGWRDWWTEDVQVRYHEDYDWRWFPPGRVGKGALLDSEADFQMMLFNPHLRDLNVDGASIAGRALAIAGQGGTAAGQLASALTANPWVRLIGILVEGDGIVPTYSATNNGMYPSRTCLAVHHGGVYTALDGCIQPVFEHFTGFLGASALAAPGPVVAAAPGDQVPLGTALQRAVEVLPDPATGLIGAVEEPVMVEAAPTAFFAASWPPGAGLRLVLVDAAGATLDPAAVRALGGDFEQSADLGLERALYRVPQPAPGLWKLRLEPSEDTPPVGTAALLEASAESTVRLEAQAPHRVDPGQPVPLTARLTGAATGVSVSARAMPSGDLLDLRDDGLGADAAAGDGVYSALYGNTAEPGLLVFEVEATGTLAGGPFARAASVPLTVQAVHDLRVRDLAAAPLPPWWGEAIEATAVVENLGPAPARVHLVWTDDSDARVAAPLATTADLGLLGPGEARPIRVPWLPSPGARTLRVEAYGDGFEDALADNRASLQVEVVPTPRTAASLAGLQGAGGWFRGPVTVTLAPFDGSPFPYASTSYALDGGPEQPYGGPFGVAADGPHSVTFASMDAQGRRETLREAAFAIDTAAPTVSLVRPAGATVSTLGQSAEAPVTVPVVAGLVEVEVLSGDGASGVARVELRVDGVVVRVVEDPPPQLVLTWDSTTAGPGRHTLEARALDEAGLAAAAAREVYVTASRAAHAPNDPNALAARLAPPVG